MRRKCNYIPVLFLTLCMVTACGKKEDGYVYVYVPVEYTDASKSDEEKEQQYMELLADQVKESFLALDDIEDMDIEITNDTDVWNVNVEVDYSDSLPDITEINQSVEETLTKFFPEGTRLSVVVK